MPRNFVYEALKILSQLIEMIACFTLLTFEKGFQFRGPNRRVQQSVGQLPNLGDDATVEVE